MERKGYSKQEKPHNQRQLMSINIIWARGEWSRVREGRRLENALLLVII